MNGKQNRLSTIFVLIVAILSSVGVVADEPSVITIDGANVLNTHADQVGVWIDSRQEKLTPALVEAIRDLSLKSLRYGWQFAVFDRRNTATQEHSPRDPKAQGFFADSNGRMFETIGPAGISKLLDRTDTVGFAVCNTDGINYLGDEDSVIQRKPPSDRLRFYSEKAADWARWGRTNGFGYFEIGNENDISGHGEVEGVIAPWKPDAYARVARRYLTEIKAAYPEAKCGINGGLLEADEVANWFQTIVATEPTLAAELDFIVAHKYEFWLDVDTWKQHAEWQFGRIGEEYLELRERLFPTVPICVTELGSWKAGENDQHYRALLAVEMLGNVFSDSAIEHVQFWPSRWTTEGGIFQSGDACELTPMGLGLKTYSRFAKPVMVANGSIANVRYFAARGMRKGLTLTFVNHASEPRTLSSLFKNVRIRPTGERWVLSSPSEDPVASDTTLTQADAIRATEDGDGFRVTLDLPAYSATAVVFE